MKATKNNINAVANRIENTSARSAWAKGVKVYAEMLVEKLCEIVDYNERNGIAASDISEELLLNGATDWKAYSYGGSALIYCAQIAETLCTPSELRRLDRGGYYANPNSREIWPDVQARALYQAARLILTISR